MLDVSKCWWLSILGWTLALFFYLPVKPVARACASSAGVLALSCCVTLGAWGLNASLLPQWLHFVLYVWLDVAATVLAAIAQQEQQHYIYDELHALEVGYFGKAAAFIASFVLIADELDLEDAFHPSLLHITLMLSLGLAVLPCLLTPSAHPYSCASKAPPRDRDYLQDLLLSVFYSSVVFYTPSWINDFYKTSQVGVSVFTSTVLAVCCVCLLVHFLALLMARLGEEALRRLVCALLAGSSVMLGGLGLLGLSHRLGRFHDPIVFSTILVSNLTVELLPALQESQSQHQIELQVLGMLVLFGAVPLFSMENSASCVAAAAAGLLFLLGRALK